MGIGSGVVYDSVGAKEYAECLLKMKFLTDPPRTFELIETLLYERGPEGLTGCSSGIWRVSRPRPNTSALPSMRRRCATRSSARSCRAQVDERLRVRLLLAEDGTSTITSTPHPASGAGRVMRFAVSATRLDSADPFLFHKTTRRELYDREWQHYSETVGADEVIYLNERGELAEGSRTNIFVERDGVLADAVAVVRPACRACSAPSCIADGQGRRARADARGSQVGRCDLSRQLGARPGQGRAARCASRDTDRAAQARG